MSEHNDMRELGKRQKHIVTLSLSDTQVEEFKRIRKFCDEEGFYMGRFLVRLAIRHIEEIERERINKELERLK